jgi:hypothetical protein
MHLAFKRDDPLLRVELAHRTHKGSVSLKTAGQPSCFPAMPGMRVGRTREKSQGVRSAPARRAGSGMLGCLNVLNKAHGRAKVGAAKTYNSRGESGNSGRHVDRVQNAFESRREIVSLCFMRNRRMAVEALPVPEPCFQCHASRGL